MSREIKVMRDIVPASRIAFVVALLVVTLTPMNVAAQSAHSVGKSTSTLVDTLPQKQPSNILGRYTRVVMSSSDVIRSMMWWARLGFTPAVANGERPDSAMTMTDGQLFITLVKTSQPSPALMFRAPNMLKLSDTLKELAVPIVSDVKGPTLGEIRLKSPNAVYVAIRPEQDEPLLTPTGVLNPICGRITELSIGTGYLKIEVAFWEMLGFVVARGSKDPYSYAVMRDNHVQIGLHEERDIETLALTYFSMDMPERIDRLKKSGMAISEEILSPDGHLGNIILTSPDGQLVYMFEGDQ